MQNIKSNRYKEYKWDHEQFFAQDFKIFCMYFYINFNYYWIFGLLLLNVLFCLFFVEDIREVEDNVGEEENNSKDASLNSVLSQLTLFRPNI